MARLQQFTRDIVLTDLPLASIRRLSRAKFVVFRSILVPSCRLSLAQVLRTAERVNEGLATLASAHGLELFRLKLEWYGFDPIHIRPSLWRAAWQEILGTRSLAGGDGGCRLNGLRLYFRPPERQWLLGMEQLTPQPGRALPSGPRVWLY